MADEDLDTRARLAVLEVMGWPDDRDSLGDGEVPPRAHWDLAGELVAAIAPMMLRHVADEHDIIAGGPGIRPSATAWMRHRADQLAAGEPIPALETTPEPSRPSRRHPVKLTRRTRSSSGDADER